MLSLSKYEIGNNHKGQALGSVWMEGVGVSNIRFQKTQTQCMSYALADLEKSVQIQTVTEKQSLNTQYGLIILPKGIT